MKSTIVLCLAALCVAQVAKGNNDALVRLQSLELEASSVPNDLRRFTNNLITDFDTKLTVARDTQRADVTSYIELAFNDVINAHDAALAQGRNPSNCFTQAMVEFNMTNNAGPSIVLGCVDENIEGIKLATTKLQSVANTAENVANEIRSMIEACASFNDQQSACLVRSYPEATRSLRNVRYSVESAKNSAAASFNHAVIQANACFAQNLAPLRHRAENNKVEALECIQNAH